MVTVRHGLGVVAAMLLASACDDPGAGIDIVNSRIWRAADRRVVVEVDLLAHERLGRHVGTYCARVMFEGQTDPVVECSADLGDGDLRTVRASSDGDLPPGAVIAIRVRLASTDVGRTLLAPAR
jgi:hypothetical protein